LRTGEEHTNIHVVSALSSTPALGATGTVEQRRSNTAATPIAAATRMCGSWLFLARCGGAKM